MMARLIIIFFVSFLFSTNEIAAGGVFESYHIKLDTSDKRSLQRGARVFVNFCMGCHSAAYMRYNRLGKDLEINEATLIENFMFGTDKPGDTMKTSMRKSDAEKFFGVVPPDLSVVARSRGVDWLYTYFMTNYSDPSRPFGVNNMQFKDTAMPHVLWELQGIQKPVFETITQEDGTTIDRITKLELDIPGTQTPEKYKKTVYDLVNFLVYLAEPAKLKRQKIGVWVIIYLVIFLVIAYFLKKEYWKDVH
jgi:ubiquinol-cytochrome c reductase cytochrome c1 subunit